MQLLGAITKQGFSFPRIEMLLKQEPLLVYKLLRYFNWPIPGLRIEVHGIHEALSLLGEKEIRRWMSVVAVTTMGSDKAPKLIRTALTRGYFCEEFSRNIGRSSRSSDLFLLGPLSVTEALLDLPIEQILGRSARRFGNPLRALRGLEPLPRRLRHSSGLRTRRLAQSCLCIESLLHHRRASPCLPPRRRRTRRRIHRLKPPNRSD